MKALLLDNSIVVDFFFSTAQLESQISSISFQFKEMNMKRYYERRDQEQKHERDLKEKTDQMKKDVEDSKAEQKEALKDLQLKPKSKSISSFQISKTGANS